MIAIRILLIGLLLSANIFAQAYAERSEEAGSIAIAAPPHYVVILNGQIVGETSIIDGGFELEDVKSGDVHVVLYKDGEGWYETTITLKPDTHEIVQFDSLKSKTPNAVTNMGIEYPLFVANIAKRSFLLKQPERTDIFKEYETIDKILDDMSLQEFRSRFLISERDDAFLLADSILRNQHREPDAFLIEANSEKYWIMAEDAVIVGLPIFINGLIEKIEEGVSFVVNINNCKIRVYSPTLAGQVEIGERGDVFSYMGRAGEFSIVHIDSNQIGLISSKDGQVLDDETIEIIKNSGKAPIQQSSNPWYRIWDRDRNKDD